MKKMRAPRWHSSTRIAFFAFLAIAAYFLWTEHRAHVAPYLTWALLIAALLLHGFLHGGHGDDHDPNKRDFKR
jgi:hypothetical protein